MQSDLSNTERASVRDETRRLLALFEGEGAMLVEKDVLQPAATLLDLYGEDIRARAYTTHDPVRGELMLRPDYTVPIVLHHMARGGDQARYTYGGKVFRRREDAQDTVGSEHIQVGLEIFGRRDRDVVEAELFSLFVRATDACALRPVIGDIGLLIAAVDGLATTPLRKAALRRHIWRPNRFIQLLERFAQRRSLSLRSSSAPAIGLRRLQDVEERMENLRQDIAQPPIPAAIVAQLKNLLAVKGNAVDALSDLRAFERDLPHLAAANDRMQARLGALTNVGVDVGSLHFDIAFGQRLMEYYDGFVFGLFGSDASKPPIATGGRYDALTAILGDGRPSPAVGGVVRPQLLVELQEGAGC